MAATTPTYPQYAALRAQAEQAARADGNYAHPAKIRAASSIRRGPDWKTCVLGHSGLPTLTEMHMLLIADAQDFSPPPPSWLATLRAQRALKLEERRTEEAAIVGVRDQQWTDLAQALPFPVVLAYNYSRHTYENWTQGAVHILAGETIRIGKLRREKGAALCTVPSTRRQQHFYVPGDAANRLPSCKACLAQASRIAGVAAPALASKRQLSSML